MKWSLAGVVLAGVSCLAGSASAQVASPRYLVMPFENAKHEPRLYWLSEGSSVLLTDNLRMLGVQVISREDRLRALGRMNLPSAATFSHATVIRLGQLLGASHVLIGAFELQDKQFDVRVRSIRLDTGRMLPDITERGALEDVVRVHARVARRLVPETTVQLEEMERGRPPLAAFEQYIKGLVAIAPAARLSYLEQALRLWSGFQRARLAAWEVYDEQGEHARALQVITQVPQDHALARPAGFRKALSLIHLARHDEAYRELDVLNRAKPDAAVLNALGVVQLRRQAGPTTSPAEAAGMAGRATHFFREASKLDPDDADLFFNLGYGFWIEKDVQATIHWLRETVRRNPTDDQAHYVLGVALQAAGSTAEAAREKELARQLSSIYAEWEAKQPAANPVPRGLERLKTEIDVPEALRADSALVATEQREQRELAAFHLERGRRLFAQARDTEAVAELRRAVYLMPYQGEAHLLLGRIYLRTGRIANAIDALKISIWSEDTVAARLSLADAFIQAKDRARARTEIDIVLTREPANTDAQRMLQDLDSQG